MALSVTAAAAAGTSATFPTHAVGDRLVVVAWRDGNNAIPTKPAAAGTVPAWLDIDAPTGTNTCSMRSATFVATATNHTTGAWTNATAVAAIVVSGGSCAVGFHAMAGAADTNQALAPDLPDQLDITGNSRIVSVIAHRNVTAWGTVPSGYASLASVATEMIVLSDTNTTAADPVTQPCTAPTLGGYRGTQIEFVPIAPISSLTDTFSTLDTAKWTASSGAVTVSGNQLRIALAAAFDALTSNALYNLTGSSLVIEFAQAPNVSAGNTVADVYLESSLDNTNTVELLWQGSGGAPGVFTSRQSLNGAPNDLDVAYSSTNHRWWQISESGGTLTWATSPTGLTGSWTTQRTLPVGAMDITGVRVGIAATSGGDATPGTAIYDNLNPVVAAAPSTGAWFGFMSPRSAVPAASSGGGTPTAGLFFEMPDMASSPKKALAHLFGPYQPSFDNAASNADYYATEFLTPTGESGTHTAYGGHLRDRPMPRAIQTGDFLYKDLLSWLNTAKSAGLDGWFCDILGPPGDDQEATYTKMRTVANDNAPGFLVVPMLDAFSVGTGPSAATIASWITPYAGVSSTWMDSGALVVASFYAEGYTVARWNSIAAAITSATGLAVKWLHVFVDISNAPTYTSINWASGGWGTDADANIAAIYDPMVTQAHTRGEKALAPIWSQVISPEPDHGQEWLEALNTLSLRNHWATAITNNPDIVQYGTWSDFSEGSQFCPTPARGQVTLDVSSYFLARWKTGTYPTILTDALYLSYRNHVNASSATLGPQTQFMNKRTYSGAEAATRYAVEALVFLTSAATVEITIAGTPTTFSAPAGMSAWTVTAATGAVAGRIIRASATVVSLTCPVAIRSNVWVQDRQYFMFGSVRGTAGQFDPMFTSAGAAPTYPSAPTGLLPATDLYPSTTLYPAI